MRVSETRRLFLHAAGREYVEAYVPYVHYVEQLWEATTAGAAHRGYHVGRGIQEQRHPTHAH